MEIGGVNIAVGKGLDLAQIYKRAGDGGFSRSAFSAEN
jgi:hypothetical protein